MEWNWVIVGGKSGSGARMIKSDWVEEILTQCREQNVAFFYKQWGGVNKKINDRELNGLTYDEVLKLLKN